MLPSDLRNGAVVVLDIARLLLGLVRCLEALEEVRVVFGGGLGSLGGFLGQPDLVFCFLHLINLCGTVGRLHLLLLSFPLYLQVDLNGWQGGIRFVQEHVVQVESPLLEHV